MSPTSITSEHEKQHASAGVAAWQLVLFGTAAASAGLFLWHRLGPQLGFAQAAAMATWNTVAALFAAATALLAAGYWFGAH